MGVGVGRTGGKEQQDEEGCGCVFHGRITVSETAIRPIETSRRHRANGVHEETTGHSRQPERRGDQLAGRTHHKATRDPDEVTHAVETLRPFGKVEPFADEFSVVIKTPYSVETQAFGEAGELP